MNTQHKWFPVFKDYYDPLMAGSIDGTDEQPHDRAITRAMAAKYRPNKGVQGEPHCTLFVARLHPKMTEEELKQLFSHFDVLNVRIVRDVVTGFSRCYGFVEFVTERDAEKAYRESNNMRSHGLDIIVEHEWGRNMKGWVPRRFGGGIGGKKEAGQLRFGGSSKPFKKPIKINHSRFEDFSQNRSGYTPKLGKRDDYRFDSRKIYSERYRQQDRRNESSRERYRDSRDNRRRSRSRSSERDSETYKSNNKEIASRRNESSRERYRDSRDNHRRSRSRSSERDSETYKSNNKEIASRSGRY